MAEARPVRPESSDEDLMMALRGGDRRAFEILVLRHQESAWRIARRCLGDTSEAEDAVQQAFLRILEAAPRYEPSSSFRTYFFRILTRLCIDRAERKRPVLGKDLSRSPSHGPGPPEVLSNREIGEAVRKVLEELPPRQRMAAILRYSEGLSLREAAGILGTTEKGLERLLARAREGLERRLSGFLKD